MPSPRETEGAVSQVVIPFTETPAPGATGEASAHSRHDLLVALEQLVQAGGVQFGRSGCVSVGVRSSVGRDEWLHVDLGSSSRAEHARRRRPDAACELLMTSALAYSVLLGHPADFRDGVIHFKGDRALLEELIAQVSHFSPQGLKSTPNR